MGYSDKNLISGEKILSKASSYPVSNLVGFKNKLEEAM